MKQKLQALRALAARNSARVSVFALSTAPVLAFAVDPTTAEEGIAAAKLAILAIIVVGGGAMVAIALARVGWTVGAKFISRLSGRA